MGNVNPQPPTTVGTPLTPKWLAELRELVQANIDLFVELNGSEWDVLVRLPCSQYWNSKLNDTARNVLFDEYDVVYLGDLYEGVPAAELPEWYVVMRQCGSIFCHTAEMNDFIEELLEKLDALDDQQQLALTRIIELTHACKLDYVEKGQRSEELQHTVEMLQRLPLWRSKQALC